MAGWSTRSDGCSPVTVTRGLARLDEHGRGSSVRRRQADAGSARASPILVPLRRVISRRRCVADRSEFAWGSAGGASTSPGRERAPGTEWGSVVGAPAKSSWRASGRSAKSSTGRRAGSGACGTPGAGMRRGRRGRPSSRSRDGWTSVPGNVEPDTPPRRLQAKRRRAPHKPSAVRPTASAGRTVLAYASAARWRPP